MATTDYLTMLAGRDDLAVIWDMRISPEISGNSISSTVAMMSDSYKDEPIQPPSDDDQSDWSLSGDWERIASLIVALAWLLVSPILFPADSWSHLVADILMRILSLAFPLACIWFAEDLAEYYRDGNLAPEITTPSPATFVRLGGWVLLLLPVLLFLLIQLLDYLYR